MHDDHVRTQTESDAKRAHYLEWKRSWSRINEDQSSQCLRTLVGCMTLSCLLATSTAIKALE